MQNNRQRPYEEESLDGQARHIVRKMSMHPGLYEPEYEEFSIASQESVVSELSFSSDSSESTVLQARLDAEPIVELPSTPPREPVEAVRTMFRSLDQTLTPESIGEALEKSGTVLMQRSRENRLAKQLEEMQVLMENDHELVVLMQPSGTIRQMQSQPAFTQEVMRSFLEHSETMFDLVHDTPASGSNVREVSGEEVPPRGQKTEKPPQERKTGGADEFVGCFSKDNDMVLYKRTVSAPPEQDQRRESIDTLIAQHAQCLVEADEVPQPSVQVYQTNDENLLALLTFSEHSSAVLKTSSATVEDANSYEDLNRVLLQTYRQLVTRPDEMISMQTQRTKAVDPARLHTHTRRSDLLQSRSVATVSFGLSNDSRSGVTIQGSSKNWTMCPDARNAAEMVTNLRLMLEEYILREIPATVSVLRFLSKLLADVLHGPVGAEVDEEFTSAVLIDKIKRVVDELLMPHELEDPLQMVRQMRLTVEQILEHRIEKRTVRDGADAWAKILATSERLVCELDHEIEEPDTFIEALQFGLRCLLGPPKDSGKGAEFEEQKDTCSERRSVCVGLDESMEDYLALPTTTVCHCFTSWVLFLLGSSALWLKEQLKSLWQFIIAPPPPILAGPSVSFRETVTDDEAIVREVRVQRDHCSETVDLLRLVLQRSPSAANSTEARASVNARSLELFARLLHSDNVELSHSDSHHNIHLQLRGAVSGDLQKRQTDDMLTVTGNIHDREGMVAVCFEAQMFDLMPSAQDDAAVEYVIRKERLSDDIDDEGEENDAAREQDLMVGSIVEDIISADALEATPQQPWQRQSIVDALSGQIKHCLQDLLEPVTSAVRAIQERISDIGAEPTLLRRVVVDSPRQSINTEVGSNAERIDDKGSAEVDSSNSIGNDQSMKQFTLAESLQELVSMFHDANGRLAMIDCDVTAIRNQVQQLVAEQLQQLQLLQQQQQQQRQSHQPKVSHGDGHRSKRRSSNKLPPCQRKLPPKEEKDGNNPTLCCPIKQMVLCASVGQYSPVEVYSCHGVAPDVLVVHWTVDESAIDCISGYEIHVDGVLRSVCFSNKRRTALIANIDLRKQHQLTVHATPDNRFKDSVGWAPAFFLYHL